jgi:hypothetical protein
MSAIKNETRSEIEKMNKTAADRVFKNRDYRLLKKDQMRGARENRRAEAYLLMRWNGTKQVGLFQQPVSFR